MVPAGFRADTRSAYGVAGTSAGKTKLCWDGTLEATEKETRSKGFGGSNLQRVCLVF